MTAVLARPSARRVTRPTYWRTFRGRHRTTTLAGDAVHLDGCPVIGREYGPIPWREMDGQPDQAVRAAVAIDPLLTLCVCCWADAPITSAGATMTTELARTNDLQGMTLAEQQEFARAFAQGEAMLPEAYRGKPASVLVAAKYGEMQQIPTGTAIWGVHVVKGRPVPSADLVQALVRRAGHRCRVGTKGSGPEIVGWCEIVRRDDPEFTYRTEWTVERAKAAKLVTGDSNWQKYPEVMVKRRAVVEAARDACPEVLLGLDIERTDIAAGAFDDIPAPSVNEETGEIIDGELVPEPERVQAQGNLDLGALRKKIWQHGTRLHPTLDDAERQAELEVEFADIFDGVPFRDGTPAQLAEFDRQLAARVAQ